MRRVHWWRWRKTTSGSSRAQIPWDSSFIAAQELSMELHVLIITHDFALSLAEFLVRRRRIYNWCEKAKQGINTDAWYDRKYFAIFLLRNGGIGSPSKISRRINIQDAWDVLESWSTFLVPTDPGSLIMIRAFANNKEFIKNGNMMNCWILASWDAWTYSYPAIALLSLSNVGRNTPEHGRKKINSFNCAFRPFCLY